MCLVAMAVKIVNIVVQFLDEVYVIIPTISCQLQQYTLLS
jgi:hypothetical protein